MRIFIVLLQLTGSNPNVVQRGPDVDQAQRYAIRKSRGSNQGKESVQRFIRDDYISGIESRWSSPAGDTPWW